MSISNVNLLEKLLREKNRFSGLSFSEQEVQRFLLYYELVLKWNPRLHLTTLVDPSLFFQHHLAESDFAASFISPNITHLWDLGSGLGVPGIPIAILKQKLFVSLVEAKRYKAIFLEEVVNSLELTNVDVLNIRIESLKQLSLGDCLTARAVEHMAEMISAMIKVGIASSQLILFGPASIERKIEAHHLPDFQVSLHKIPASDQRYIFDVLRST